MLLDDDERARWLKPGMTAVDLGAAPGGWTWQLVHRSIRTIAIDNGPMDAALMDSGVVEHRRVDGFRYRPPRAVDWLVCDMVEQPRRIAELDRAMARGRALPARDFQSETADEEALRRSAALSLDRARRARRRGVDLRAKQLYHDREEITVYAGAARHSGGSRNDKVRKRQSKT